MTTDIEKATYKGYGTVSKTKIPSRKRKEIPDFNTSESEPPNWKKVKQDQKEKKVIRKTKAAGGEEQYELSNEAKKIWEQLRRGDCSKKQKTNLCKNLHNLIKGKVYHIIKAHDTVRVIECLLQNGDPEIRTYLFLELKDKLVELMKSKYSKFFVTKMLVYGTKNQRNDIIQSMMGKVVKLMSHINSSDVVELSYNDYANEHQRSMLMQEFYGPRFRILKSNFKNLGEALEHNKDIQKTILSDIQRFLQPIIEKGVFTNTMIHTLLKDFMTHCDESDRFNIIDSVCDKLLPIIHSRDGARFAMMCLWYGTNKQRKVILKAMKTNFVKVACESHAYMVLLAAFDCVDDTVFLKKAVITELMASVQDLLGNLHGRKIVEYLIAPRNNTFFNPDIVAILAKGDDNPNTKKPIDTIHSELQDVIHIPVLQAICDKIQEWYKCPQMILFVGCALKILKGENTSTIYEKLSEICGQPYVTEPDEIHFLDIAVAVKLISYLISIDKEKHKVGEPIFSTIFLEAAESVLVSFTLSNRGCFILLKMIETGISEVAEPIIKKLKPITEQLLTLEHAGGQLLGEKIQES